jgi:hypothetical protein
VGVDDAATLFGVPYERIHCDHRSRVAAHRISALARDVPGARNLAKMEDSQMPAWLTSLLAALGPLLAPLIQILISWLTTVAAALAPAPA